jgi:RNA polymerase sigma factor (sigma-70 family)
MSAHFLDPEAEIINRETREYIRSIIKDLSPKHSLIIMLKYWHNMSCKNIALIIKSTPGCVRVTLHNIRGKLRKKIENSGNF